MTAFNARVTVLSGEALGALALAPGNRQNRLIPPDQIASCATLRVVRSMPRGRIDTGWSH